VIAVFSAFGDLFVASAIIVLVLFAPICVFLGQRYADARTWDTRPEGRRPDP
jgi:hypothetical protein